MKQLIPVKYNVQLTNLEKKIILVKNVMHHVQNVQKQQVTVPNVTLLITEENNQVEVHVFVQNHSLVLLTKPHVSLVIQTVSNVLMLELVLSVIQVKT